MFLTGILQKLWDLSDSPLHCFFYFFFSIIPFLKFNMLFFNDS